MELLLLCVLSKSLCWKLCARVICNGLHLCNLALTFRLMSVDVSVLVASVLSRLSCWLADSSDLAAAE